jgi:hypothetical protein
MRSAATSWKHPDVISLVPRSQLLHCAVSWPTRAFVLFVIKLSATISEHAVTEHIDD